MINPSGQDRHGEYYEKSKVTEGCLNLINSESYFYRRSKQVTKDYDKATDLVNGATESFERSIDRLIIAEGNASEASKKVAGKVKDATQKLADGLLKIEKQADFERLERVVGLLERAEKAMLSLADLEQSGKLDKITAALR